MFMDKTLISAKNYSSTFAMCATKVQAVQTAKELKQDIQHYITLIRAKNYVLRHLFRCHDFITKVYVSVRNCCTVHKSKKFLNGPVLLRIIWKNVDVLRRRNTSTFFKNYFQITST